METTNETKKPVLSLVRKLAEVMGVAERVPKNGVNTYDNYNYALEADIVSAVRKAMAERNLLMVPHVVKADWSTLQRKAGTDRLVILTVRFTVKDGDSGEEFSFEVLGEGADRGDKATYKAMTGATKYALMKLFLLPTGDEPESDENDRAHEHAAQERKQPRRQRPERGEEPTQKTQPKAFVARFGPHKGTPVEKLKDDELRETIRVGKANAEDPKYADHKNAILDHIEKLEATLTNRAVQTAA
jgi:hypothetical protein